MKLEFIKNWTLDYIQYVYVNVALNNDTLIALAKSKDGSYCILVLQQENIIHIPLPYLDSYLKDLPVLFSLDGKFGIVATTTELYYYTSFDNNPEKITIKNSGLFTKTIPKSAQIRHNAIITDTNILPVCFEDKLYTHNARYYGFLEIDLTQKSAKWLEFSNIDYRAFPFHRDKTDPPKIDSLLLLKNELFAFVSGSTLSVAKWGMDYYGLVKISTQGKVLEKYLDSGNLNMGGKKRGVNGTFAINRDFLIMTPVFKSDDWKGKQKIFSLKTKDFFEFELPRETTNFKVVQVIENSFWLLLRNRDQVQFALCKGK